MTTPTPTSLLLSTRRADARQQVFVAFGVICLACLILQAIMIKGVSSNNDASSTLESDGVMDNSSMPPEAGLSQAQLETILSSIAELSVLVKESAASLHHDLGGVTCTIGRRTQEPNPAEFVAMVMGILAVFLWFIGLVILTDGLYKISSALRNHVWGCGLLGANVGLGFLLAMPAPENWFSYFSWTLWPMHLGMVGGLVFDRRNFLAEEADVAVKT